MSARLPSPGSTPHGTASPDRQEAQDGLAEALAQARRAGGAAAPAAPPPIGAALENELAKLAPRQPRRPLRAFALLVVASTAYAALLLCLLTVRRDAGELPTVWLAAYVVSWLLAFSGLSWIAMVPPVGQVMPRIGAALSGAWIAIALFTTLGLVLARSAPSSTLAPHTLEDFARFGHGCLRWGMLTALLPLGLGAVLLRGVIPVGGRAVGAAMGAAGGCLGGAMLHVHCPIADSLHLGLVHGGVVFASAALGALLLPAIADR